MKRLLKLYVRNDLFNNRDLPDIRNRRYFPTISTIRAHMVSARKKMQLSLIDQEALIEKLTYGKKKILPSKYSSDQKVQKQLTMMI